MIHFVYINANEICQKHELKISFVSSLKRSILTKQDSSNPNHSWLATETTSEQTLPHLAIHTKINLPLANQEPAPVNIEIMVVIIYSLHSQFSAWHTNCLNKSAAEIFRKATTFFKT